MSIKLDEEWARDMIALGVALETARPVFEDIHRQHASAERHYHGLSHLRALFELLRTHSPQPAGSAVRLAVWLHDMIYDPLSAHNEAESARLARAQLTQLGIDRSRVDRVCALIEATKNHYQAA